MSALSQTEGAIVAIVISLTIVAVQVSSQAYSLRITDLLLRYPFFWLLLFLYGAAIIYDVTLLNMINNNAGRLELGIDASIFFAAILFGLLFPYAQMTLERLRPQTIIRILGKHILASNRGTFDFERMETILPLFDIMKKSIRADDIATARESVKKTKEVCCGILSEQLNDEHEEATVEYFAEQYQRTARIAFIQNDIDSAREISRSLVEITNNITSKELSMGRSHGVIKVTYALGDIGILAIEKRWEDILGFVADSLSVLSFQCATWKTRGVYLSDKSLQGANRLPTDVTKDTSNEVLHLLTILNLESMQVDILLAARNTKRPLISAYNRLINERLPSPFYEKACVENIHPVVREVKSYDWLLHVAEILAELGTKSAEILGNGVPASYFKQYLVSALAPKPVGEQQIPQETLDYALGRMFNYINEIESDKGAIWLIETFEGIGNEYGGTTMNIPVQSVISFLGHIGSSLGFAKKQFTAELPRKALDSIATVLRSGWTQTLEKLAFDAVFRIMAETDDPESRKKALAIFEGKSQYIEGSAFKKEIDECTAKFKSQNGADLKASSERAKRLEQFIKDVYGLARA